MKNLKVFLFSCFVLMSLSGYSQTVTQINTLQNMSETEAASFLIRKAQAVEWAKNNGYPVTIETGNALMEIQYIDENGRPQYFATDNVTAAATISTNKLYSGGGAGLSLTGSGITVREWDGGSALTTHQEFDTRATSGDGAASHYHSTHVGGTIMASGVVANARGMAYQASLRSFDWNSDVSEMASEAAAGALISNHSYGYVRGWYWTGTAWSWAGNSSISAVEDYLFGFYDASAQQWDQVAFNAPNFLICKSSGNDRSDTGPGTGAPADGPYDCIGQQGVSKNVLTVGAVDDIPAGYSVPSGVAMSSFSSWGPADDGRIKPDIVANGVGLYSAYNTNNTSYASMSGTSMATPSVAGSLALLQQHYYNLKSSYMRSATLKALVIHTADEAGTTTGPDYVFGWGLMNTKNAALKISADQSTDVISEHTLNNGASYTRDVVALGTEPLKVTIVWTDPAGTPPAASLDPITPMLVNDLDLRLTRSTTTYYPWKLDRDNPTNAATNAIENNVDNVEVVYIASPVAGATYTITVDHDGTLTNGSQAFSMVISGITSNAAPVANFTASSTNIPINTQVNFTDLSVNGPTSWSWSFSPATVTYLNSTTSTSQNPQVQFTAAGKYTVTLTATNSIGSDSETKTEYITAISCTISTLPFTENFDLTTIPTCWTQVDNQGSSQIWQFGVITGQSPNPILSGNYAFLNSDAYGSGGFQNADLVTPTLNLTAYSAVALEFNHYFKSYAGSSGTLSYSINNGASWTVLAQFTTTSATNPEAFYQIIPAVAGQAAVKFKWNYTGNFGYYWAIDNVRVASPPAHDITAVSLDMFGAYNPGSITPKATVKNVGANTETFPVTLTIGAYTSTKTVTALATGASQQVTFDAWTAAIGTYTAQVCSQLAGDLVAGNNCASKGVRILVFNKQVYAYNATHGSGTDPNGPTSFNLNSPGTLNSIADQSAMQFVMGGTWAAGIWYGTVYNTDAPFDFVSIDQTTGARTVIGTQSVALNGISYNTANSTLYGVAWDQTNSNLYSINIATGATTLIGSCGPVLLINLAINSSGQAYALDISNDVIGTVNLTTGAFTSIGSIGFDANYAQDMEFDRESGELFLTAFGSAGWLGLVNKTTGYVDKIGDFEGGAEVTGLAIPYPEVSDKTLNLTSVILQGLYNGSGGMNPAYDDIGLHWPAGVADHITVELHSAVAGQYGTILHTATDVALSTSGTATVIIPGALSGSYYITIKHRNSIETTTAAAVSFAGSTINQSFGAPANVFGANLIRMPDESYAIYGGDVNQDYIIDLSDLIPVGNLAALASSGYLPEDVNGDGLIDLSDLIIVGNNAAQAIGAILP